MSPFAPFADVIVLFYVAKPGVRLGNLVAQMGQQVFAILRIAAPEVVCAGVVCRSERSIDQRNALSFKQSDQTIAGVSVARKSAEYSLCSLTT